MKMDKLLVGSLIAHMLKYVSQRNISWWWESWNSI